MGTKPDRGTVVTPELATESERLRARRAEVAASSGLPQATADLFEARLRQGRAGLDTATIDRLRGRHDH